MVHLCVVVVEETTRSEDAVMQLVCCVIREEHFVIVHCYSLYLGGLKTGIFIFCLHLVAYNRDFRVY